MRWHEIRQQYPHRWLLVEAIQAHTEADKRIVEQLSVIGSFLDSVSAMQTYKELHHREPHRELYVLHTSREEIDITERRWLGIRGSL